MAVPDGQRDRRGLAGGMLAVDVLGGGGECHVQDQAAGAYIGTGHGMASQTGCKRYRHLMGLDRILEDPLQCRRVPGLRGARRLAGGVSAETEASSAS